jgi:hypothetical protein
VQELATQALENGIVPDCPAPNMAVVPMCMSHSFLNDSVTAVELGRSYIEEIDLLEGHLFDKCNLRCTNAIWAILAGDDAYARQMATEALEMARAIRNPSSFAIAAEVVGWTLEHDDPEVALAHHEESISATRQGASDVMLTNALVRSGLLRARSGDRAMALNRLREAVAHSHDDGDPPSTSGSMNVALIALSLLGEDELACRIGGAVSGPLRALVIGSPSDMRERDRALENVAERLGEQAFRAAMAAGDSMTYDEVVSHVLRELDSLLVAADV